MNWEDRFWTKVEKTDTCWLWTGALTKKGAGQFSKDSSSQPAHRISYELHHGPIPDGAIVKQTCKNRICVHPGHLMASNNRPQGVAARWIIKPSEWTEGALCANYNPSLWDGDTVQQTALAKRICKLCPIATRTECLQEALDTDERYTIRGGMTPEERARLRRAS